MIDLLDHRVTREDRADGTVILRSGLELGPVARTTCEWLEHWAHRRPGSVFIAERSGAGWRAMSYAETREAARAVAASLLARGIGAGDAVVALSGPGVDHGVLALATQYIGATIVPLAEQYSLIPDARHRLIHALSVTPPKAVYTADAAKYAAALSIPELVGVARFASVTEGGPAGVAGFDELLKGSDEVAVDAAHAAVTADTVAKILFTSGSTSLPKGVPQTQGMMTVNQAQYLACLPFLAKRPPRILDWLPWNHVFAGNSDFNMMLSNGGSLYLDDGKPLKGLFERTLENVRHRPGTISCNVPIAYVMLVEAMRADKALREAYFADLDMIFYAGASLPRDVWKGLEDMAKEVTGEIPFMTSSWGMTETAPSALLNYQAGAASGNIGVPVPGLEEKLIPIGAGRYELRVRGPQVMSGYYRNAEKTAEAFDDEGFLITGDAVRMADEADDAKGVYFDGRVTEDFKLLSGTWVHAASIRLAALAGLKGIAQDIVVTGADKAEIGLLIFPTPDFLARFDVAGAAVEAQAARTELSARLKAMAAEATGSSNRIARALLMMEPPSVKDAEITAKGSLNIRAILSRRAELLDRLYDDADPATVRAAAMDLPEPTLRRFCDLDVELGPIMEMGDARAGRRRIIPITGGRARGEDFTGKVLNLGADWQTIFANGVADLDTRYAIETDDGAIIEIVNKGYRHGSPEVVERLAKGEPVDPAEYYMRTSARLESADPRYEWVNRKIFVGVGARLANVVRMTIYAVE